MSAMRGKQNSGEVFRHMAPEFKNLMGKNLMIYTFPEEEKLIVYQAEMLANNHIKGLLKTYFIKINGQSILQYDVTSLVSLKKLLERKKLIRREFIFIINQIVELLGKLEEYLLDCGGILFDSIYVFADPQDLKLSFAYIPVKEMPNDLGLLKTFLLNLIINDIRFADEPSDNYVRKIIETLKAKDFSITLLKEYLTEISGCKKLGETRKDENIVSIKNRLDTKIPQALKQGNEAEVQAKAKAKAKHIMPQKFTHKQNKLVGTTKLCYPLKTYIIVFSVIGAFVLLGITLIITGVLSPINPDFLLSLFGFILIGGAIVYLICSKLFTFNNKVERVIKKKRVKSNAGAYVNKAFPLPEMNNIHVYKKPTPVIKDISAPQEPISAATSTSISHAPRISSIMHDNYPTKTSLELNKEIEVQDKTVLLNAESLKLPQIKRIVGNNTETIIIEKFPFMIGRLENHVDYFIKNPAVGKLHAEMTKTTEGYFISDLNSKNGTFINGERIEPGKENRIQNEDYITLGNEKFVFFKGK